MTADYVIALTTLPADADAAEFGRTLIDERLAACVNLLPVMESVYRWEGKIEFEANGNVKGGSVFVYEVNNGKLVELGTTTDLTK